MSIIMEPAFFSKTVWYETAKIHLEMQIDTICLGPPSTTTLGELFVLERTMLSLNGFGVESHSDEGSLPFLVGSSQSSSGDCQPPFYGRKVANRKMWKALDRTRTKVNRTGLKQS